MIEVAVGPPHLITNQGHTVLVTEPDGGIPLHSQKGLFFRDTRLISHWSICANGEHWQLLNGGSLYHYACRVFLTNPEISTERGTVAPHTLELVLSRSIDEGMHEDIDILNHGMTPVEFNLELLIQSDFADIFEVKAEKIVRRGHVASRWSIEDSSLRTTYRNKDFCREIAVRISGNDSPPAYANGRIVFAITLKPRQSWHSCLFYELGDGKVRTKAPSCCVTDSRSLQVGLRLEEWHREALKLETTNELVGRAFKQAIEDVGSLRLPIESKDRLQFVPAGGVPWFVALFGRDSLIASLQNAYVHPHFARGILDVLGDYQAADHDEYRDAEPGKILHELRLGELAYRNVVPHSPYYGTADATILYLIVLHTAWRCSGDRNLLERHYATAERCLHWIERYGDRDGDGFQEYATRSPAGYENQGWKDAHDAVLDPDGSPVEGPKALCELQGYVYDAWMRMAEILDELEKHDAARALRDKAATLFNRFNETFWDEEAGFYAYALDGKKRKVLTIASNPGHCLWSGIVPRERAGRVVQRLMASDMSSGWGIRTLSAGHPAYNPLSYQNGSVWPHDNGLIALGLRRYGFAAEACRIAHDIFAASKCFARHQMPELFAGLPREAMNFPVQHLGANVPQAWAAGSILMLLQAILGVMPDAPRDRLNVDPCLPDWLPDITVRNLRVGERKFDIRFWREKAESFFEVLSGERCAVSRQNFATGPTLRHAQSIY
ncbi:MAG: amylo-alpha-1,6-glucosidase [Bradyrhizobium sp.]|uniref:amylo-alpha-1,6-glucosidase n=1 Tax=Bradyrhizobium sp. TaxID=376 RepID=UPI00238344AA|nr:glycogen debranching N-terminal domain-containing protein [Bradyrhizobium sp.]MDE2068867.1 amylo-alpha-1,6-glucosidase [Bradyrhizobium sp.]MDE2241677.1 amylo-alpha-1,6-glucosidase [Bradyrhizobium sp.]MDE2470407.1 amylo-alpha-1,6-glucosidase [Bradyrhizobium sp.]